MKKLRMAGVLSVLVGVLISCGFGPQLSPPSWIIGTWSDSSLVLSWEFTQNNVIYTAYGTPIDYGSLGRNPGAQLSDSATSTTYAVTLGSGGVSTTFPFAKVGSTTIN
jgi:hypothetical protein